MLVIIFCKYAQHWNIYLYLLNLLHSFCLKLVQLSLFGCLHKSLVRLGFICSKSFSWYFIYFNVFKYNTGITIDGCCRDVTFRWRTFKFIKYTFLVCNYDQRLFGRQHDGVDWTLSRSSFFRTYVISKLTRNFSSATWNHESFVSSWLSLKPVI